MPRECSRSASRIVLTNGAELFHLGEVADSIYLISSGRLRLTLPMQVRGQEGNVLVEERSTGQTVGWSALIPPYRFTLTATAALETEVIAIDREALRKCFAESRDCGDGIDEPGHRDRPAPAAVPGHVAARDPADGGADLRVREMAMEQRCWRG